MDIAVFKRTNIICYVLTFVNALALLAAVLFIPLSDSVETSLGDRRILLLFPFIMLFFNLFYTFGVLKKKNDKANYTAVSRIYFIVELSYIAISWALVWQYFNSKRAGASELYTNILLMIAAIAYILVGNYLPQVKQCKGWGLKTKWTKENEVCWNKTHRLLGRLIMATGITELAVTLCNLFTHKIPVTVLLCIMLTCVAISFGTAVIYAYRHRND